MVHTLLELDHVNQSLQIWIFCDFLEETAFQWKKCKFHPIDDIFGIDVEILSIEPIE